VGKHDVLSQGKALFWAGQELVVAFNQYLATRFGTTFQMAVDWVLLGLAFVVLIRLVRFSFDVLRYVLVPSIVISGIVSVMSPISFLYVMPLAMGAGTLFLLFKN
jgi:hypothetical protein